MGAFRGVNYVNLDAKGRLAIPTRYRDTLLQYCEGHVVATIATDERCLLLYPLPEWEEIQRKVELLPTFDKQARRIQRLLIGHATDIQMDRSGRTLLPTPLREYAGLGKRVVMLGQGFKFEIWSDELWEQRRDIWLDKKPSGKVSEQLKTLVI